MPLKHICRDFLIIVNSSSWSKTTLFVYFKEQIWLPNRKCNGEISSVPKRINAHNGLIPTHKEVLGLADSNGISFEATHLDVSELWSVCMHYFGNGSS